MKASAPRFALAAMSLIAGIGPGIAAEPLEARDMLELAVLALKGDEATALEMFNRGHPAFRRGDLYVYCADANGKILAHGLPDLIGRDLAALKDKTGKEFGLQLLNEARWERIKVIGYYLPKPNASKEVYKEDYFTKVGKLTCGVGYYSTKDE
ncbi:cache domain-containing protein [Bradyrhizobium cajani]|uniref:Chemotaxis protein n=1 Tax=Bradyrhizobium cajani TaxID=1928661 RepID=A0A844TDB8_9BRAD|nr:cache domain-containing protein [Bradyrhizobium cajani]MCP3370007.1 cache domain-containing protein [Bradyrhizobium cajani]MVT73964.1 chemotaxis protein [Bradyrhizobium cajani]